MAGLCRVLIAATLVVHLTVGCCSHHAHGCDGMDCPSVAHSDAAHDHDGQYPDNGGDRSPHGAQDCQGVKCSFVFPSRTATDSVVRPFQTSFAVLLNDQTSLVGCGIEQYSQISGRLMLPVRLHLANQVLLI